MTLRGWQRTVGAGLLLLAVYVGLSFLNSPRGFLGTDTGGKVATLKVMSERGRFDPDLGYWAERWDPDGALHPIGYTTHTSSGTWVNVTTLPALWVGWELYRLGGYRAALLVPMAGAVASAFAGLALLRRLGVGQRHAWWGFWLLGLASPLTVYALDFWEHTLGVALMAWAVVLLVDRRRWAIPVAGGLFGTAATMRTEALVYLAVGGLTAAALSLRSERDRKGWRSVGVLGLLLGGGAAVPVMLNELFERAIVGSTVRGVRVVSTAERIGDVASARLREGAITLLGLESSSRGIAFGACLVALLVFAARRRDAGLAFVATIVAACLTGLRFAVSGLGFVSGLGPAWILPAAAVAGRSGSRSDGTGAAGAPVSDALRTVVGIGAGAIPLVLMTQYLGGAGPQWAGRYLLESGFLLAVAGWAALELRPVNLRLAFGGLAAATAFAGVLWLNVRSHDIDRAMAALNSRPEPVVVSGVYHLGREGGARYGDRRWLTLSPSLGGGEDDAARVLAAAGITRFVSVEFLIDPPLRYAGFRPVATDELRLFDGVDLRVTSYRRSP